MATVFGKDAVKNPTYAGIAISLFDLGYSKEQVSQLALDVALGTNPNAKDVVNLIWTNLTGRGDLLDSEIPNLMRSLVPTVLTASQLTTMVADLDFTAQAIDLVGLSKTGWEYIPYGG